MGNRDQPLRDNGVIARSAADQIEIADDRGQQIIEILRDPGGELTHRLHSLRLREPYSRLLKSLPFPNSPSNIAGDLTKADQFAGLAAQRLDNDGSKKTAAILANAPAFLFIRSVVRRDRK